MLTVIIAALLAALAWSLNFIVPFVIGDYSPFDFALFRFLISGLLGCCFLACNLKAVRNLRFADWRMAFFLGLIGYLGYFLAVVGAAIYAGPVVAPAFLGLVPVVLAIAGNWRQHTVPQEDLMLPLSLSAVGLILVNIGNFNPASSTRPGSVVVGIAVALVAVGLWTWFGLLNQTALAQRRLFEPFTASNLLSLIAIPHDERLRAAWVPAAQPGFPSNCCSDPGMRTRRQRSTKSPKDSMAVVATR